jgi:hypothetical protein
VKPAAEADSRKRRRSIMLMSSECLAYLDPEVALLSPMDSITHMLRSVETRVLESLDLTCSEI